MEKHIYIAESGIAGRGLYTSRDFKPGEIVARPVGKRVHANDIDWDAVGKEGYDWFLQVGAWEYIDGRPDPFIRFINHSCNPNLGFRDLEGKVKAVAIKPIKKGTELSYDYSTTMFEELDEELMPCNCGAKNCRKVIGDFRNMPKEDQQRYIKLGIVPDYVLGKLTQTVPLLRNKAFGGERK